MDSFRLPSEIRIARVELRIRDLDAAVQFYQQVLGLVILERDTVRVTFGTQSGSNPLLVLHAAPGAPPHGPAMTGLFHVALRFPTRRDLAHALLRLVRHNYPMEGASNHLVSEALYLSDPEGNGIELYADLPREQWQWRDGQVVMATHPLDLRVLLATAGTESPPAEVPAGTDIGHIHLQVADLSDAERFFQDFLGLDVTQRGYPGALFFSAGGYHHHVGANIWGRRSVFPDDQTAGLIAYRFDVPGEEIFSALAERAGTCQYPSVVTDLPDGRKQLQVRDPCGAWLQVGVREG